MLPKIPHFDIGIQKRNQKARKLKKAACSHFIISALDKRHQAGTATGCRLFRKVPTFTTPPLPLPPPTPPPAPPPTRPLCPSLSPSRPPLRRCTMGRRRTPRRTRPQLQAQGQARKTARQQVPEGGCQSRRRRRPRRRRRLHLPLEYALARRRPRRCHPTPSVEGRRAFDGSP